MLEFSLHGCSCVAVQFVQWLLLHGDRILLLCDKRTHFLSLVMMMLIYCSDTYKTEHDNKYYNIS
jgi:hypothetical protein